MSGLVPFQLNTPIGQTLDGQDVYASRAFVDYLFQQIFGYIGGPTGQIPVENVQGDGDATHFLNGANVYSTPNYPVAASPSSLVGLTLIPGGQPTFMRSDAAPALNVGINPTWTGLHTFSVNAQFSSINVALTGIFSGALSGSTVTASGAFGCNGKIAQTAAAVNAAVAGTAGAAYTATEQGIINANAALTNQIRAALVANGITV